MISLKSLCTCLTAVLAVSCGSLGWSDDEYASPLPTELTAPGTPATAAPHAARAAACSCSADCQRPRGHFRWFRRQPAAETSGQYDTLGSGCNMHPEPPFGASYQATMQAQVTKGEAGRMVLHHFDFAPGEATLNYRGQLRLQKIARLLPQNSFPVVIEATRHDPTLDAARYANVVSELALFPFPVPAQRVVVGSSPARGMDGLDAELVHQNLLNLSAMGGTAGQSATPGSGMGSPAPRP